MKTRVDILTTEATRIMDLPNVLGFGYGLKEIGGVCTDQPVLTILVQKKMPASMLPPTKLIPRTLGSVQTDVLEVGEIVTLEERRSRVRPAAPGMSIGHERVSAGTFGALVHDADDGSPFILSNNHVLANATDGQDGRAQAGDTILQPGRHDGGSMNDEIARLERYVPLVRLSTTPTCSIAAAVERVVNQLVQKFWPDYEFRIIKQTQAQNLVDAAIARPLDPSMVTSRILEIGLTTEAVDPTLGMWVQKSGRTTGWTEAKIKVTDAVLKVAIGDVGFALFNEQIITTPLGQPGDSGSLVLTEGRRPVGLLAAGSQQVTICNKITPVLSLLNIDLVSRAT